MPRGAGRVWVEEEAEKLSRTPTPEVAHRERRGRRGFSKGSPGGCLEAELLQALPRES